MRDLREGPLRLDDVKTLQGLVTLVGRIENEQEDHRAQSEQSESGTVAHAPYLEIGNR